MVDKVDPIVKLLEEMQDFASRDHGIVFDAAELKLILAFIQELEYELSWKQ